MKPAQHKMATNKAGEASLVENGNEKRKELLKNSSLFLDRKKGIHKCIPIIFWFKQKK